MKIIKIIINTLYLPTKELLYIFDALKLWSLNLIIPIVFVLVSPLVLKNLYDIPLFIIEIFKFWLVEGFRFNLVLFILCLIISIFDKGRD